MAPMHLRPASALFALGLSGCPSDAPPPPVLPIVLSGCASVLPGPICVNPGTVRAWLPIQPAAIAGAVAADTGAGLSLSGSTRVEIHDHAPIHVRFETRPLSPGRRRHLEGRDAHRAGQADEAMAHLQAAAELQAQAGDASGAALSAQLLAFIHRAQGQLQVAREVLDRWQPPQQDGAARAMHAYFRGLIALAGADTRAALRAFDEAALWAARLDLPLMSVVQQQRALTWATLGRAEEAIAALTALEASLPKSTDAASICARADLLTNLGWVRLQSDSGLTEATGAVLARADDLYARCPTAPAAFKANVRLNRSLWASRMGRVAEARTLSEAIGRPKDPTVAAWAKYLRARLSGDPEALASVARQARSGALPALAWRAFVDAAELRPAHAIEHLRAAEAIVAQGAFAVPADAGRIAFAEDRQQSARGLIAALIRDDQPEAAMDAARRARRRILTTLPASIAVARLDGPARARWEAAWSQWRAAQAALREVSAAGWTHATVSEPAQDARRAALRDTAQRALDAALTHLAALRPAGDDLRAPAAGELIITGARRPDGGWWIFARDAAGTTVKPVTADGWRGAIAAQIERAQVVRVLGVGPIGDDAGFGGRAVVHALDLPPRPTGLEATRAVIIADPTGNLPQTRVEATRIEPGLQAAIGPVTRIQGAAAGRASVLAALEEAEHLHYAGHARHAGFEGWGSALPVRDGVIELGDLLALPRVPRSVVLSGCEAGKTAGEHVFGVGLAHALLVRGAHWVIAPVRVVDDAVAARVGEALYQHRAAGLSWPQALQAAQDDAGTTAWRMFVP